MERRLRDLEDRENNKTSVWTKLGVVIGIIFLIVAIIGVIFIFGIFTEIGDSNDLTREQAENSNEIIYIVEEKIIYIQEIINNFFNENGDNINDYNDKVHDEINNYNGLILS